MSGDRDRSAHARLARAASTRRRRPRVTSRRRLLHAADAAAAERARLLAERLGVLFWEIVVAPDGGYRPAISGRATDRLLGAADAKFLGGVPPADAPPDQVWRSRIHPDDAEAWEAFLPQGRAVGDRIDLEYRLLGFDGIERIVAETGLVRAILPDGSAHVEGVVIDVSEHRDAHRARLLAESRVERLEASLIAYVYEAEVDADGVFHETGDAYALERFLRDPPPTDPGELEPFWQEHIVPEDRSRYERWCERTKEPGRSFMEYRMRRGDGEVRTVGEWTMTVPLRDGSYRIEGVVVDMTEAALMRERAVELERHLASILGSVDLLVTTMAVLPDGRREERYRGGGAVQVLGLDADAAEDALELLLAAVDRAERRRVERVLARAVAAHEPAAERLRLRAADGAERVVLARWHPRPPHADGTVLVDCLYADVTADEAAAATLAAARDEAEQRLRTDDLTGVASRRHGVALLDAALARVDGGRVAVALVDIDHFKRVNDVHLHAGGDEVLREIARRLALVEAGDVARFGGEEFLVVRDVAPGDDARSVLDALRRAATAEPIMVGAEALRLTLSVGLAIVEEGVSTEEALARADGALYAAKRRGRDRLVCDDEIDPDELLADDPEALRLAEAMSRAVGEREGESEIHCGEVSHLAGAVAVELGLGATVRLRCRVAGMLHDIGKIGIPEHILRKPGRFTPEERLVMQRHAAFGAEIVARVPSLADTAPAVRHHHERWDGGGYPDGIAGAAIPVEARIIAAVDTWSAMRERRVYADARTHDAAVEELRASAGSQLDPAVVRALLAVIERHDGPALRRDVAA